MKVSVLTPTIRKEGLDIVRISLSKQGFRDFEWLIGSKFNPQIPEARWIIDDFKGGFWSLNRIYNKLITQSAGELIISLQDNIFIPSDAIEKMWNNYQNTKAIISGVGDQYESINKWGKPQVKIWSDPRKTTKNGSFYEIYPSDCEWNFCVVPRQALVDVGGFDEELDQLGFGMDGYQVNERMDAVGYKFYIDQSCESFTVRHDRSDFGGEDNWNKHNNLSNGQYKKRKNFLKLTNQWPKLKYLKILLTNKK